MRIILFTLALSLAACAGDIGGGSVGGGGDDDGSDTGSDSIPPGGGGGGGSGTARIYFNANVYPIVANSCGTSGCHSATSPGTNAPGYVSMTTPTQDPSAAWTLITGMTNVVAGFSATAPLLSIPANTSHYKKFTTDEAATITSWLALESSWRTASGGSTATDYMAQWSGCMQITDFKTTNVATAFAQQVNTNEGYCKQCHVNGQASSYFVATPDSNNMFTTLTTYREYLSTYFTIDTTTNKIIVNQAPFKLAAVGGTNGAHPNQWNPTSNKGMTALANFAKLTQAHLDGTTTPPCGAATLSD